MCSSLGSGASGETKPVLPSPPKLHAPSSCLSSTVKSCSSPAAAATASSISVGGAPSAACTGCAPAMATCSTSCVVLPSWRSVRSAAARGPARRGALAHCFTPSCPSSSTTGGRSCEDSTCIASSLFIPCTKKRGASPSATGSSFSSTKTVSQPSGRASSSTSLVRTAASQSLGGGGGSGRSSASMRHSLAPLGSACSSRAEVYCSRHRPSFTLPPTCDTTAVRHQPAAACGTSTRLPLAISSGGGNAAALAAAALAALAFLGG